MTLSRQSERSPQAAGEKFSGASGSRDAASASSASHKLPKLSPYFDLKKWAVEKDGRFFYITYGVDVDRMKAVRNGHVWATSPTVLSDREASIIIRRWGGTLVDLETDHRFKIRKAVRA